MKAALINNYGEVPHYGTMPDPLVNEDKEVLMQVKSVAISNFERVKVSGEHAIKFDTLPAVICSDGVGSIDGKLFYGLSNSGMMAEKAAVLKNTLVALPDGLNPNIAAALPVPLFGSDAALLYRSNFKKGNVVLVNGATGITGKTAVQIAKLRGASTVIAVGRNQTKLEELLQLGADKIINLSQPEEIYKEEISAIYKATPIDIVLDYLWGKPTELLLDSLHEVITQTLRLVSIGASAGTIIDLKSLILRVQDIEIVGSGFGAIPFTKLIEYNSLELPHIFQLAAEGKLKMNVATAPLSGISAVWTQKYIDGERMVINI